MLEMLFKVNFCLQTHSIICTIYIVSEHLARTASAFLGVLRVVGDGDNKFDCNNNNKGLNSFKT